LYIQAGSGCGQISYRAACIMPARKICFKYVIGNMLKNVPQLKIILNLAIFHFLLIVHNAFWPKLGQNM